MSVNLNPDLFQLAMSDEAQPLMDLVKKHCVENVAPIQEEFYGLHSQKEDRWSWHPRQLELLEEERKDCFSELSFTDFYKKHFPLMLKVKTIKHIKPPPQKKK